jgi:hypothetical protein
LIDGTRAYDEPTDAIKREWNLMIQYEDISDALLTNLKLLYETRATLLLDEDALIVESNIPVYFKTFKPIYQFGGIFHYQVGLQEI